MALIVVPFMSPVSLNACLAAARIEVRRASARSRGARVLTAGGLAGDADPGLSHRRQIDPDHTHPTISDPRYGIDRRAPEAFRGADAPEGRWCRGSRRRRVRAPSSSVANVSVGDFRERGGRGRAEGAGDVEHDVDVLAQQRGRPAQAARCEPGTGDDGRARLAPLPCASTCAIAARSIPSRSANV